MLAAMHTWSDAVVAVADVWTGAFAAESSGVVVADGISAACSIASGSARARRHRPVAVSTSTHTHCTFPHASLSTAVFFHVNPS